MAVGDRRDKNPPLTFADCCFYLFPIVGFISYNIPQWFKLLFPFVQIEVIIIDLYA